MMPLLQKYILTLNILKDLFAKQKIAQRNPRFQEIPLFASSIYFTLPEIVMGPIWVPNASINTSWANLRVLIICYKTIFQRSISKLIAIDKKLVPHISERANVPTRSFCFSLKDTFSYFHISALFSCQEFRNSEK